MFQDGIYRIYHKVTNQLGVMTNREYVGSFTIQNETVINATPDLHIKTGPLNWNTEVAISRLNNGYQEVDFTPLADNFLQKSGSRGDWGKEGYSMSHDVYDPDEVSGLFNPKHHSFTVSPKTASGEPAGEYIFGHKDGQIYPIKSETYPEHRRKGLATAVYRHAQKISGRKLVPAGQQSPDAESLWDSFNKSEDPLEKAIPAGMLVIYADGDDAGSQVEKAVMKDELDEVKKISARITKIGHVLKLATKFLKGEVINAGGDDFCALIPKDYDPKKLEFYRKNVKKFTGFTVTIGVGDTSPHAIHALLYGKMNGKDQTVTWSPEVTEFVKKHAKSKDPKEKAAEILGAE